MRNIISLTKEDQIGVFDKGEGGAFLRADKRQFQILNDLWKTSLGLFWTADMVDFSKDGQRFKELPEHAKRMFKLNNGYQALMDSGVVNIYNHLVTLTNNSDIAKSYSQIAFMESIHADSYSTGLIEMFGSAAEEVIDIVYTDETVRKRLDLEIDASAVMIQNPTIPNIFVVIAATYLLERVKFPFSFFVTLSLNKGYNNAINGFSQLISRIASDELEIHVPTNKVILKHMIEYYNLPTTVIEDMCATILEQELEWNKYLLKDGPIPGYNERIGEEFIRYSANKALRDLGIDVEPIKPNDFVNWFNFYRDPNNKQVSQQEAKSTQYQKGTLRNDLANYKDAT